MWRNLHPTEERNLCRHGPHSCLTSYLICFLHLHVLPSLRWHHKTDMCHTDAVSAPRRVGGSLTSVICYLKRERGEGDVDPGLDCLWTCKWDRMYLFHIWFFFFLPITVIFVFPNVLFWCSCAVTTVLLDWFCWMMFPIEMVRVWQKLHLKGF